MLEPTTTVPTPWWVRLLAWLALPPAGAALLFLVARLAGWLPLPGPLRLVRGAPEPAATIVVVAVGVLLGAILAALVDRESLTVRLSMAERDGRRRDLRFPRERLEHRQGGLIDGPSHTVHRGSPAAAPAGNSTYRSVPETISVHRRPGAGTGSSIRHRP